MVRHPNRPGVRAVDLIMWFCMIALAAVMLVSLFGCSWGERIDRTVSVAERALDKADEIKEAGEEIREGDWNETVKNILIGTGAVLAALGGGVGAKKGYDKLKKNGKEKSS